MELGWRAPPPPRPGGLKGQNLYWSWWISIWQPENKILERVLKKCWAYILCWLVFLFLFKVCILSCKGLYSGQVLDPILVYSSMGGCGWWEQTGLLSFYGPFTSRLAFWGFWYSLELFVKFSKNNQAFLACSLSCITMNTAWSCNSSARIRAYYRC